MIVRFRPPTATGNDDPFERDPKPGSLPELSPFPVLEPLPDDGTFQDILYRDGRVFTFEMTGDIAARVSVVARQIFGLDGSDGFDALAAAFVGDWTQPWKLRGDGPWSADLEATLTEPSHRKRLLDALGLAKKELDAIAKRTCEWVEENACDFALHKLALNDNHVSRERARYWKDGRLVGHELHDLAIQWRRIVRGAAAVAEARADRAMLEYLAAQNVNTLFALALHLLYGRARDNSLATGLAVQQHVELEFNRTVASAGTHHPVLFKLWSRSDLAGRVIAALDEPTKVAQIAALLRIDELWPGIEEVLDKTHAKIETANELMQEDTARERVWSFEPLIRRVRIAGRIVDGTVEARAIEERCSRAPVSWLSRLSSAASLLAFAGVPLAAAVAGIAGLIELAIAAREMWQTDDIAQAALVPMDSLAAEWSLVGIVVAVGLFVVAHKFFGAKVMDWLMAVQDAVTVVQ